MNHKKKIVSQKKLKNSFRKLNTVMEYFCNPHFDKVATTNQKKTVLDFFAERKSEKE